MTGWWPSILIAPVVVAVFLLAPYVRDGVGELLSSTIDIELAAVPRSVLVERLHTAETELARTRYQAILYQTLLEEYQGLRAEVGVRNPDAYMTAQVLARPPRTHFDTLLIAAGEGDGVHIGDTVTIERILVGAVSEVSSRTSVVTLASSPGAVMDVEVQSAIVVLQGLGGGAFELEIPRSVELRVGDQATDARGLLVAVVRSVSYAPTDIAQTVELASPISFAELREVSLTHP
ncbi:MAG: rod shape-determining protein MreC [Patescibacteria group bacterium]